MNKMYGYHFKRFLEARGINPKEQRTEYKGIRIPTFDSRGTLQPIDEFRLEKKLSEEKEHKNTSKNLERKNTHNKKGIDTMNKTITNKQTERSIQRFLRTQGTETGTLETEKESVLVPNEYIAKHLQQVKKLDLTKDVRIVETDTGIGKFLLLKKTNQKFTKTAAIEEKGLPKPETKNMEYEAETYRGELPIPFEMIEDADVDVVDLLTEYLAELEINTKNSEIINKMKTATAKTVANSSDIKTLLNKEIKTMYNAKAYLSVSLFDELDQLKDESGRFLLQDDSTVQSGKRIGGKEVVVIEDDEIGTAKGDLVGFFGDLHELVTLFDRKRNMVQWADDNIHGLKLMGSVRFDTQVGDKESGYYVTYEPTPA